MNFDTILHFLSNIGDSAVLLALVVMGSLYFLALHRFWEAAAVAASFLFSSLVISVLKLFFIGCGNGRYEIVSPSGHAALSLSVYGIFALLIYIRLHGKTRIILPLLVFGVAACIAVSRIIMKYHTLNEVVLGSAVGLSCLGITWYFLLRQKREMVEARREPKIIRIYAIPLLMLATVFMMHGTSLHAEQTIRELALQIKEYVTYCKE